MTPACMVEAKLITAHHFDVIKPKLLHIVVTKMFCFLAPLQSWKQVLEIGMVTYTHVDVTMHLVCHTQC